MRKIIFSDVTARDGLQSLKKILTVEQRVKLIKQLSNCMFSEIEVGSLVNPKIIPAMKDSLEVYTKTLDDKFKSYVLVGNEKNITDINFHKIKYFSLFTSPSNQFNINNINTDVEGSFERFKKMINKLDKRENHYIKGYISCVSDCPFEGEISIDKVLDTIKKYKEIGVDEICLADTIGTLKPDKLNRILQNSEKIYDNNLISLHLHTENELTTNRWKENLNVAINNNVYKFDTSLLGIGGCPAVYSKNRCKTGNLNIIHAVSYFKEIGLNVGNFGSSIWYEKVFNFEKEWNFLTT
tara:strand:+ start:166 stop:1053 length:888 start_codon:yes stop_codon:yes gene_type:complete